MGLYLVSGQRNARSSKYKYFSVTLNQQLLSTLFMVPHLSILQLLKSYLQASRLNKLEFITESNKKQRFRT